MIFTLGIRVINSTDNLKIKVTMLPEANNTLLQLYIKAFTRVTEPKHEPILTVH